jgi:hypothetical protein
MLNAWVSGVKQKSKLLPSPSFDPNEEYYGYAASTGGGSMDSSKNINDDRISPSNANNNSDKDYRSLIKETASTDDTDTIAAADKDYRLD